jgi:hypothetical protein
LLSGVALGALLGAGQAAQALIITPSFDASWTAAAPAAATAVVQSVIAEYEADFSNNVTTTIAFGWGEVRGIAVTGGASTIFAASDFPPPFGTAGTFGLAQVKGFYAGAAAAAGATQVLATANANLPAAYPNPGQSNGFFIPDAEYKALTGGALNADPIDGYTGYATNFCGGGNCPYDYTGGAPGANAIDFKAVVEHEVAHALGRADYAFFFRGSGWRSAIPDTARLP